MTIGDRIKIKRNELNMTLLELSTKIGVREATVQRYESGNIKNLKQETIGLLAEALNTTPAYLMGWESTNEEIIDGAKQKKSLRSIARLDTSEITEDEDAQITKFIDFLIKDRNTNGNNN